MHFYFWVLLFLVALLFSVCSFMCVYFWPVIPTVRSNRGLNISRHGRRYFTTCISINVAGSSGELINLLLLLWSSMIGCWSGVLTSDSITAGDGSWSEAIDLILRSISLFNRERQIKDYLTNQWVSKHQFSIKLLMIGNLP